MTKTLETTFDGEMIHRDEPLELEPNTQIPVTIETWHKPKKDDRFSKQLNL